MVSGFIAICFVIDVVIGGAGIDSLNMNGDFNRFREDQQAILEQEMRDSVNREYAEYYEAETTSEFHRAVIRNDLMAVREALVLHPELIHSQDNQKVLPLTYAALLDYREMAELLLEKGADVNRLDSYSIDFDSVELFRAIYCSDHDDDEPSGFSVLHYLATTDHIEMMKLLLEHGGNVTIRDVEFQQTPLWCAAHGSDIEMTRFLIRAGAELDIRNFFGETLLNDMVINEYLEEIELFLECGADIEYKNKEGETLLVVACFMGHGEVVQLLLKHGANVNAVDFLGDSALHFAVRNAEGIETVKCLVEAGANINIKNHDGETPLLSLQGMGRGLEVGNLINAEFLIARGADVYARDGDGNTLLHKACQYGSIALARLALAHGIDINVENEVGYTPLEILFEDNVIYYSSRVNKFGLLKYLVEQGANVNHARGSSTRTVLHFAIAGHWNEVAEYLLSHGAMPNSGRSDSAKEMGNSFLEEAIMAKNGEAIKLLVQYGADPNVMLSKNDTLLHFALWNKDKNVLNVLLDAGADPNVPDANGMSFLDYVFQYHPDLIDLFW